MTEPLELKWKRPESVEYPKIWRTFKAKDVNSDEIVQYRIEDLPESRLDDVIKYMKEQFCRDEPICEAYDVINDPLAIEDFKLMWIAAVKQKTVLVCCKEGSNEVAGINLNSVSEKGDKFTEETRKRNKSVTANRLFDIMALLYENFDTFEHYGVDKYLTSFGLIVNDKYRGRGVGEEFLKAREAFCHAFDIKLSSTVFSSNSSNRLADKTGFKVNKLLRFEEIRKNHPEFELPPVNSEAVTLKSIQFK